jgi:hypothetical protein
MRCEGALEAMIVEEESAPVVVDDEEGSEAEGGEREKGERGGLSKESERGEPANSKAKTAWE